MEKGVTARPPQNEGRGRGASSVGKDSELGLTHGQKKKTAIKRPDPNGSLTVNQDGCRKTARVTLFHSNRLTY